MGGEGGVGEVRSDVCDNGGSCLWKFRVALGRVFGVGSRVMERMRDDVFGALMGVGGIGGCRGEGMGEG